MIGFDDENQFNFRNSQSNNKFGVFDIPDDTEYVFNVTDPLNVKEQLLLDIDSSDKKFATNLNSRYEFVCVRSLDFNQPQFFGQIQNQNLHSLIQADFIIVSHPDFLSQAQRLANFHIDNDNISVVVATTDQVYNEFSSEVRIQSQSEILLKCFMTKTFQIFLKIFYCLEMLLMITKILQVLIQILSLPFSLTDLITLSCHIVQMIFLEC